MPNLAVSYVRFSRPEQLRGGSLQRQLKKSAEYAEKHGLTLDNSLQDLGRSAFRGKHAKKGAFSGFLEAVEKGKIPKGTTLIVESLDRLSREEIDIAYTRFCSILRAGIIIVTLTPEDTWTRASLNKSQDIVTIINIMARAREESATKSVRLLETRDEQLKQIREGKRKALGRTLPVWLKLNEDKTDIVFNEPAKKTVELIIEKSLAGMGSRTITKFLNKNKIPTLANKARKGNVPTWHDSFVMNILHSRALIGEFQPTRFVETDEKWEKQKNGEPIKNFYKPLLTEDQFFRLQSVLKSRKEIHGRSVTTTQVKNLFAGILRSAVDGHTMRLLDKGNAGGICYVISMGFHRGEKNADRSAFPYNGLEEGILSSLVEILETDLFANANKKKLNEQIGAEKGRLLAANEQMSQIKKRYRQTGDESFLDMIQDISKEQKEHQTRIEQLQGELSATKQEVIDDTGKILKLLQSTKNENELYDLRLKLRGTILSLIESIWVLPITCTKSPNNKRKRDFAGMVQIYYKSGESRKIMIYCEESQFAAVDIRKKMNWEDHFIDVEIGGKIKRLKGDVWDLKSMGTDAKEMNQPKK